MVLMVRSFRSTLNLISWVSFSILILLSMFAIYCVESKPSFPNDMTLYQQKRDLFLNSNRKDSKDTAPPATPGALLPTNLVLVSTLDGSIRGIDRFQGVVHWTLKGGPGSSLIKSNSNFETHKLFKPGPDSDPQDTSGNSSDEDTERLFLDTFGDVLTDGEYSDDYNDDPEFNLQESSDSEDADDLDIYYIIEPQDGGTLYLYGDGRPLEKLPFSIQDIVNNSPFSTPDGTTYIGRKNTLMIEIDPRNGKILQQIDLNKVENQFRMPLQSQYPARTIVLGRTEYKVSIYDDRYKKLWNVTYSEYAPNKLNWDVPATTVPSDIYIAPDATSAISGINVRDGNFVWTRSLPYPVVSVFDVYRREDYTFALSRQEPPKALNKGDVGDMLSLMVRKNKVTTAYVGVYDGSLYALSTKNYPLIQISPWASMYTGRRPGDTSPLIGGVGGDMDPTSSKFEWTQKPHEMCCHGCEYHTDCLVGQHVVQSILDDDNDEDHPLYHHSKFLHINGPSTSSSASASTSSPSSATILPSIPRYHFDDSESEDDDDHHHKSGFFQDGFGKFWKSYILASSVIVYVYRDRVQTFYQVKVLPRWKKMLKKRAKAKRTRARIEAAAMAEKEKIRRERADSLNSLESFDAAAFIKEKMDEERKEIEAAALVAAAKRLKQEEEERKKREKEQQEEEQKKQQRLQNASKQVVVVKKSSTGLDLESFKQSKSRVLEISDNVLGYGSHGTVVYKGMFDGREVAVKRLLLDFYDVALKEVKLLQESDDHPNVVRYFYKEESDRFLYIALELCFGSLNDYMERTLPIPEMQQCDAMNPANILSQFTCGLQYLHSLKIVHRDIKPHNILLAPSKHRFVKDAPQMRVLISDFGLCKKLDGEQSSFNYTAASPAGTSGWRAPELLAGALAATSSDTSFSSTRDSSSDPNTMVGRVKATRAIDIFSAGCVFYYVLSNGDHPFGNRFGRENNILNGTYDLSKLDSMGEDGVEAKDLVERMISTEPKQRPNCDTILSHPFFWSTSKRLAFLQDASDRFEIEERDPPSLLLQDLESDAPTIIGVDWYKRIDRVVANDLGKFRKYDGKRVRDLLRALRNKKHHWQDLPDPVKKVYGEPPNQFLYYFTTRFPHLLLHTYYVVASHPELKKEGSLGQYF